MLKFRIIEATGAFCYSIVDSLLVKLDREAICTKRHSDACEYQDINITLGLLWLCTNAFAKTWNRSPKANLWLYTAVNRPRRYASMVWLPRVLIQTVENDLHKVQRLVCLCTTCVMRTTAKRALESLLNLFTNGWWLSSQSRGHCDIYDMIDDQRLTMPSDQILLADDFIVPRQGRMFR